MVAKPRCDPQVGCRHDMFVKLGDLHIYRPNVAAIVRDKEGRILLGERNDYPDSWQFPQGGCDPGETPEEALPRELREEVSLEPGDYRIVAKRGPYRYLFTGGRRKEGYRGQEQH